MYVFDCTIWGFHPLGKPAELTAQYLILNLKSTKFAKFGIILRSEGCLIRLRPYKLLNRLVYRNMFKNTCFYRHSEHVNFAVQGSFLASPSLLHKELTHESNHLSSRNLINQISCLSTKIRGSYGALFRGRCYFIRNGRNPFGNPEYLTQVLVCMDNAFVRLSMHASLL